MKISATIITLNEEKNIGRCIDSLSDVADEIIVVDSNSSDKTVEIAKEKGALVSQTEWKGYSETKNYANSLATHDYIFSIDADEALSEKLRASILSVKDNLTGVYCVNRLTNFCGKWVRHSGWYPDKKIRLFPKHGTKWEGEVHENLIFQQKHSQTLLAGNLLHYSFDTTQEFEERSRKYALLSAKQKYENGKKTSAFMAFLSGFGTFWGIFAIKLGIFDGNAGFKIALISAKMNRLKYKELLKLQRAKAAV